MMIDFALAAERNEGLDSRAAIYRACLLRFRPIMMTTLAAMFAALPLALITGDGLKTIEALVDRAGPTMTIPPSLDAFAAQLESKK